MSTLFITQRITVAAFIFAFMFSLGQMAAADDDQQAAKVEVKQEDRYAVPDGDSAALLKFIDVLRNFKPETADQFYTHRTKAPAAMKAAAEKILKLEKDPTSPAAHQAKLLLLSDKVGGLAKANAQAQSAIVAEIADVLKSAPLLSGNELGIAFTAAGELERAGNKKLATKAYQDFGALFAKQKDEQMASYGAKMQGAARRIDLVGNDIKLTGKLVDGTDFAWKDYRGKVVLVDFWATWCGPCIQELPNVKKNYAHYHEKGFEVVGISLDSNRGRLEEFLEQNSLPWKTLFEDSAGWDHPIATYYGVMGIPTVILVDQQGKVVSLAARGSELGRLLEELLGEAGKAE